MVDSTKLSTIIQPINQVNRQDSFSHKSWVLWHRSLVDACGYCFIVLTWFGMFIVDQRWEQFLFLVIFLSIEYLKKSVSFQDSWGILRRLQKIFRVFLSGLDSLLIWCFDSVGIRHRCCSVSDKFFDRNQKSSRQLLNDHRLLCEISPNNGAIVFDIGMSYYHTNYQRNPMTVKT